MPVVPPTPRFQVEPLDTATRITIPSKKNWFIILFMGFWLMGWALGEVAVLGIILTSVLGIAFGKTVAASASFAGISGFLLIWLGAWTVGGGYAIYTWLWQIAGKEVIEISSASISIAKKVLSFSHPKEYEASYIQSLRVSPPIQSTWSPFGSTGRVWGTGEGIIAFDYGAKTYRFGSGLDEAEAKMISSEIMTRYPQYAPK
jgi:hypothetical protein